MDLMNCLVLCFKLRNNVLKWHPGNGLSGFRGGYSFNHTMDAWCYILKSNYVEVKILFVYIIVRVVKFVLPIQLSITVKVVLFADKGKTHNQLNYSWLIKH